MRTSRRSPAPSPSSHIEDAPGRKLEPGSVVSGRYKVIRLLGEGAMGAVYEVEHAHMRKPFALKVLHARMSSLPEAVARFEREAVAAGSIGHPNVAAATDFGKLPDGSFFLILEYVAGRSLRDELNQGRLEPRRVLKIMQGVASGVAAAHAKGIVHRDLKPENIMLVERDGDPDFVKVLDFGIAKLDAFGQDGSENARQALTKAGTVVGTPEYMSPEQSLGRTVDARSDLYSLGVVLFELLTGDTPFHGGAATLLRQHAHDQAPPLPPAIVEDCDPLMAEVVRKLLAKDPDKRYQTATKLMTALEAVAGALATKPTALHYGVPKPEQTIFKIHMPRWLPSYLGSRRALIGAGVLATAAIVACVFAFCGESSGPSAAPSEIASGAASATSPPPSPVAATVAPPTPASTARSTSRTSSPAPKSSASRKTGPGGIYIPPPRDWFK